MTVGRGFPSAGASQLGLGIPGREFNEELASQ